MNSGIYVIKNEVNEKRYIGMSINLRKRKRTHKWELRENRHVNKHLQRAYNKYGAENFSYKVLEHCEKDKLNEKEKYYISLFDSMNSGYNLTLGGEGTQGYKVSKETRKKISIANKGSIRTTEQLKNHSKASKKMWKNEKDREKQRIKLIGNSRSKGRVLSKKEKERISKHFKGSSFMTEEGKRSMRKRYQGEKSMTAKLKESDVIEIRTRFLNGEKQYIIKKDYPVTTQTIYDIVRNRRWKHIPNTIKELETYKRTL